MDVINTRTKLFSTSSNGTFTILAKEDDALFFVSKNHIDKTIIIGSGDFNSKLSIELVEKPIELEEVKITTTRETKITISQKDLDMVKLEKDANKIVVQGVYTGETANGVDFRRMAKGISNFFKKNDEDKLPPKPVIVFKDFIAKHYPESFFIDKLDLNQDQIYAFIDYCNSDPKAAVIVQENNVLATMEFLMKKAEIFKKLK